MTEAHNCGRCHTCGTALKRVLDGEEWCPACVCHRSYHSHGFAVAVADANSDECPPHPPTRFRYRLTGMVVRDARIELVYRPRSMSPGRYIITGIVDVRSHVLCMPFDLEEHLRLEWEDADWEAML